MLKSFRIPGRLAIGLTELNVPLATVLRRAGLPRDLFDQERVLVSTGNSALELNEAAYLLGFENSNSFGRAFHVWEGMPPATGAQPIVEELRTDELNSWFRRDA